MQPAEIGPIDREARTRVLWAAALIALAGVVAYHNSFAAPFFFDDRAQINDNPTIRHLWPLTTPLSPPANAGVGGRPLLNLSFAFNYALGGMNPWGYHAYNLAVHILAGLALFGLLRRTLHSGRPRGFWTALVIALIWVVHPVQTEAVTYVAERAESQMGLFYLLTLYCFVRYAGDGTSAGVMRGATRTAAMMGQSRTGPPSCVPRGGTTEGEQAGLGLWGWLSIFACLLGMGTKEVVVTAPIVALLIDRTFFSGDFRTALSRHWRVYAGFICSWVALLFLLSGIHQRGVGLDVGGSWWAYLLTESGVILRYLGLAVWPHPLVFDYGMGIGQPGWEVLPHVVMVVALVAGSAWALLRPLPRNADGSPAAGGAHGAGLAGAWFFLILAPTSSVVAVAGQPMAEHRLYLPVAAVITVVVLGTEALGGRLIAAEGRRRAAFLLLAVAAVVACAALTIRRNATYRSEVSLWADTVEHRPGNERALNGLGLALAADGRLPAAIAQYEEALRLKPDYADAHQNLGAALRETGRILEAVNECEAVARLRPDKPEAHFNLGVVLQLSGQGTAAVAELEEALRLRPAYADAENNLGLALAGLGRFPEAVRHFGNAVRLEPANPDLHQNLGSALFEGGDVPAAVLEMREAVRLRPDAAEAHYNLAVMLQRLGRDAEARTELEQARRLGITR